MQELKIQEMMAVMRKATTLDEDNVNKESAKLVQLVKENESLRELLQISREYGSLNSSRGTDETDEDGANDITQIENLKTDKEDSD